jgi:hypothetical protein
MIFIKYKLGSFLYENNSGTFFVRFGACHFKRVYGKHRDFYTARGVLCVFDLALLRVLRT